METYSYWEAVPAHLKTKTSLKKAGLKLTRGQKPVAHIETRYGSKVNVYSLYDMREAVPNVVSDAQRAAVTKAQAASLAKRTCTRCGFVQELSRHYRRKMYVRDGICDRCVEYIAHEGDRLEAIEWAQQTLARTDGVLILDTETTDLDGEIIELAIINLAGETLYNSRYRPTEAISRDAQAVHGISAAMLADAPRFADEYPRINAILTAAPLVLAYGASFDRDRLAHTCRLYDLARISFHAECLMFMYAQFVNDWSDHWQSYRWQPLGGDHGARGDCRAALACLHEMAAEVKEE